MTTENQSTAISIALWCCSQKQQEDIQVFSKLNYYVETLLTELGNWTSVSKLSNKRQNQAVSNCAHLCLSSPLYPHCGMAHPVYQSWLMETQYWGSCLLLIEVNGNKHHYTKPKFA
jgi:hypothetical protein